MDRVKQVSAGFASVSVARRDDGHAAAITKPFSVVAAGFGVGLSALDDIDRQTAASGLLVLAVHVGTGLTHGLDDFVE